MLDNFFRFTAVTTEAAGAFSSLAEYAEGNNGIRTAMARECGVLAIPPHSIPTVSLRCTVIITIPLRPEMRHLFPLCWSQTKLELRPEKEQYVCIFIQRGSDPSSDERTLAIGWQETTLHTFDQHQSNVVYADFLHGDHESYNILFFLLALFAGTDKWTVTGKSITDADNRIVDGLRRIQQRLRERTIGATSVMVPPIRTVHPTEQQFLRALSLWRKQAGTQCSNAEDVFSSNIRQTRSMLRTAYALLSELGSRVTGDNPVYIYNAGQANSKTVITVTGEHKAFDPWYTDVNGERYRAFDKAFGAHPELDALSSLRPNCARSTAYNGLFAIIDLFYGWYCMGNHAMKLTHWRGENLDEVAVLNGTFASDIAELLSFAYTVPHLYPAEYLAGMC